MNTQYINLNDLDELKTQIGQEFWHRGLREWLKLTDTCWQLQTMNCDETSIILEKQDRTIVEVSKHLISRKIK